MAKKEFEPALGSSTKLKAYFITGLVILLPLALTLAIFVFLFNLLTEPFVGIVSAVLGHYGILNNGFFILSAEQIQKLLSQIIIIVLLFFFTVGLGLLARWFFFHYLIRLWEYVVAKIPIIRSIYRTCQEIIDTLFMSTANSFKQVVLVPFPSANTLAIGFVTRDDIKIVGKGKKSYIGVFVPTTPNPTSGFLMMFNEQDLVYVDMKIEEALKYVISCGVIGAPFQILNPKKLKDSNTGI